MSDAERRIAAALKLIGDQLCASSAIYVVRSTAGGVAILTSGYTGIWHALTREDYVTSRK